MMSGQRRARARRSRRFGRSRIAQIALGCLALLVLAAPQLLGGSLPWTSSVIAGLAVCAGIAGLVLVWTREPSELALPWSAWAFAAAIAMTALQLTPMPCGLVRLVAPQSVDAQLKTAQLLNDPAPSLCVLTADRAETQLALLRDSALLTTFLTALFLSGFIRTSRVVALVAASGSLMALVALGHLWLGAERVFGVYAPLYARPQVLSPLLNGNHLAGLLVVATPPLLAVAIARTGVLRVLALLLAGASLVLVALTESRGGATCAVLAICLFGALLLLLKPSKEDPRRSRLVFAGLGGLAVLSAIGALWVFQQQPLEETGASKLTLVRTALEASLEAPWTGTGRGAFAPALGRQLRTLSRPTHPENLLAEWLTDWGFLVTCALVVALARDCWVTLRGQRSLAPLAALAGALALAAQNLADFSLELPGIGVVAAVALGAAFSAASRPTPRGGKVSRGHFAVAVAMSGCLLLALGPTVNDRAIAVQRERLRDALTRKDGATFAEVLPRTVRLHPSEPTFPLLAGIEARQRKAQATVPWLRRSAELAPGWPHPYVELSLWFLDHGDLEQAAAELNMAAVRDARFAAQSICRAARTKRLADLLFAAAPATDQRDVFLDVGVKCRALADPSVVAVDAQLVAAHTLEVDPYNRTARRLLQANKAQEALTLLAELPTSVASTPTVAKMKCLALLRAGRAQEALALAQAQLAKGGADATFLELRARSESKLGLTQAMRGTLEELRQSQYDSPKAMAATLELLGQLEAEHGDHERALAAYEEAYALSHEVRLLLTVGRLAERLGRLAAAHRAFDEACRTGQPLDAACTGRERLRKAMASSPLFSTQLGLQPQ